MNQEIKQKIDQIKKGKIPNGYKKAKWLICPNNWTIDRLNSYLSENKDKNVDGMYTKDDVLSVSGEYGVVNQIELMGRSYAGESILPYHIVETGDIVYTKSPLKQNPYGIIKLNEGKPGIVSTLYAVYHCEDPIVAKYLNYFFQVDNYLNNYLLPLVKKGAKNDMKVNNEDVLKGKISFPPLEEQQKIAEILMQCDKVIELYGQEIEELKKLKKAYLRKMFPQKGQNVPELRFAGFTDPWEQRKANELCSIATGKSNTQDQVKNGLYPFFIRSDTPVRSNKYLYDCEAVITIGDGNIGKVFHYINGKFDLHQRCYKMADFKGIYGKYFYYYFSTNFYNRAKKMTAKATVDSVRLEMISGMNISFPRSIIEQQKIAEFFTELDNLITLHQRKLEEQKNQKKSLMQLLLTGIVRVKI